MELVFLQQLIHKTKPLGKYLVEDDPARGCLDYGTIDPNLDLGMESNAIVFVSKQNLFWIGEYLSFSVAVRFYLGKIVTSQSNILGLINNDRFAISRQKDILRGKHQHPGLNLGLNRQGNMHCHLVAIEIGIESGTDQRMNPYRLLLH